MAFFPENGCTNFRSKCFESIRLFTKNIFHNDSIAITVVIILQLVIKNISYFAIMFCNIGATHINIYIIVIAMNSVFCTKIYNFDKIKIHCWTISSNMLSRSILKCAYFGERSVFCLLYRTRFDYCQLQTILITSP